MIPAGTIPLPNGISRRVLGALRKRKDLWRFLQGFCRAAERARGAPYLVGGIVRDLIEGRPGRDIDLMVTGIGFDALGKIVLALPRRELGIRRVTETGKRFAVYKVSVSWSAEEIDVALARAEHSTGTGHRQFEVLTDRVDTRIDASRRDFTINSLMFSLRTSNNRLTGEIIDFFGGREDLHRRRIRGVGNPWDRIREDPLRMLRAIRQKNERSGYRIEKRTWQAICGQADELLGTIPVERLVEELGRSLAANPSGTVSDLFRAGILPLLIPEIPDWGGGPLSRLKKRFTLLQASLGRTLPETVLFANLLVDVARNESRRLVRGEIRKYPQGRRRSPAGTTGKESFRLPCTEAIARRLHVPRVRRVVRMVEDLFRLSRLRIMRNPNARIETIFGHWEDPEHLRALYAATRAAASRSVEDFRPVLRAAARRPPLLSGVDILAMGVPAGPRVESILEEIREATITGRVADRKGAKELALRLRDEMHPLRCLIGVERREGE